ncbi:hypothetical protein AZI85_13220 [Bdellovibrio bacteriovorus]|uniref:PilZ domain-containing protein n=1 Tax=Bdellovibrio bacteriovorus TaxID=959 RepID=A0A150WBY2_BDEBC|nr:PilZ domain-containing protein [Bdellovibrio bacteriovorus]KYG60423.1 hypothetical protein AZI85_13220 [Bdellovibrio bacteriovorus]
MHSSMQKKPVKDLIYLSSSQNTVPGLASVPAYLQGIQGVRWHLAPPPELLKDFLKSQPGELFVIVHSKSLSVKVAEAFLAWTKTKVKVSFIFIAQTIEKATFQLSHAFPQALFLYESEGLRIGEIVTRRLQGKPVKSRKQERMRVQSEVMLKKSVTAEASPTGSSVQFLKEGHMQDFSQGGAQITVEEGEISVKDFISLMYKNRHGRWVSVESQVRWVVSTAPGEQIIGVQFLAVSA